MPEKRFRRGERVGWFVREQVAARGIFSLRIVGSRVDREWAFEVMLPVPGKTVTMGGGVRRTESGAKRAALLVVADFYRKHPNAKSWRDALDPAEVEQLDAEARRATARVAS